MITIKEMAEMLGISTTTVSNVINGKTSEVSQKTAEKVQKLLDEYDYVPNMNAKNLAQNHSRLIGIVLKRKKDKYRKQKRKSAIHFTLIWRRMKTGIIAIPWFVRDPSC